MREEVLNSLDEGFIHECLHLLVDVFFVWLNLHLVYIHSPILGRHYLLLLHSGFLVIAKQTHKGGQKWYFFQSLKI